MKGWRHLMRVTLIGHDEITITLKDFWERSVNGFGSFSQEISKSVYDKHVKNKTETVKNYAFKSNFKKIGESFYIFIEK